MPDLRRQNSRLAILGMTALTLAAAILRAVVTLGTGEESVRLVIRQTANISMVLFCTAFTASALLRLMPSPLTHSLMRNRRWIELSFALSHLVHLLAVLYLSATVPDFEAKTTTVIFGGLAYVFIAALAATSFDGAVKRLGARNWKRAHTVGTYYIWLIFALSYFGRAAESSSYIPAAVASLAVLAVRTAPSLRFQN